MKMGLSSNLIYGTSDGFVLPPQCFLFNASLNSYSVYQDERNYYRVHYTGAASRFRTCQRLCHLLEKQGEKLNLFSSVAVSSVMRGEV